MEGLQEGWQAAWRFMSAPGARLAVLLVVAWAAAAMCAASAAASSVATWGSNESGQLGDGLSSSEQLFSDVPVAVSGVSEAVQVAEGCHHDLALLANGTVMAWGANDHGQLGYGKEEFGSYVPRESDLPVRVQGLEHVKEVAAGCDFSIARLEDGEVRVWGEWPAGEGTVVPVSPGGGLSGIVAIAANDGCCFGGSDAYAVSSSGAVYAWGWDGQWELGYAEPVRDISTTPQRVEGVAGALGAAAGSSFAAARTSAGGVVVWGGNHYGQHGNGRSSSGEAACYGSYELCAAPNERAPGGVSGLTEVEALAAGGTHALVLTARDEVSEWGSEPAFSSTAPLKVNVAEASAISAGAEHDLASTKSGALLDWGTNERGSLGIGVPRGPETCPGEVGCARAPHAVSGFLETPHLGSAATNAALAKAPGPTLRAFSGWLAAGALSVQKLGATMPLNGAFNGRGALHGQAGGEVTVAAQAVPASAFKPIPVTFGMSLVPARWDGGPEAREYMHVSYLSLLGLTIPTSCTTTEPLTIDLEAPVEGGAGRLEAISGTATISGFRCTGGFLGEPFSPILTVLVSGPGNSYTLTLEA